MNNMFMHSMYLFLNMKELSNIPKFYYYLNTENTRKINNMYFHNKEMYDI